MAQCACVNALALPERWWILKGKSYLFVGAKSLVGSTLTITLNPIKMKMCGKGI